MPTMCSILIHNGGLTTTLAKDLSSLLLGYRIFEESSLPPWTTGMGCLFVEMGIDYYGVLNLQRQCNDYEIKRAFRRLILQYNPTRQQDESLKGLFELVAEAYDVLGDPFRRAVYDQYGEEGLKRGVPGPQDLIQPYVFHGDPMRTYREFFGTDSPFADLLDVLIHPLPLYDTPEGKGVRRKEPPLMKPLLLTLEEVFYGGIKKVKINRLVLTGDEKTTTKMRELILNVPIKPGLLAGTEFKFIEAGDQGPTIISADIVLVTEDRAHSRFVRDGLDLIMVCGVDLKDSLVGVVVKVDTLDGRKFNVPITSIISPDYEKIVEGEGMPLMEDPDKKGNLIIRFKIEYPHYLPKNSKNMLKKAWHLAEQAGGKGSPEQINHLILADKMRRISQDERLPD